MMNHKISLLLYLFFQLTLQTMGQKPGLDSLLENNISIIPALNERVSISVSNTPFQEFMRGVANNSGLNVDVSPDIDIMVVNNFNNVRVLDMLVFLEREYNLEVEVIGNIVTISQGIVNNIPNIKVDFNTGTSKISLDVEDEDMYTVSKKITEVTGNNVIVKLPVRAERISCYIKDMPFDDAIEKLALANNLELDISDDGFYIIDKPVTTVPVSTAQSNSDARRTRTPGRSSSRTSRNQTNENGDYILDITMASTDSVIIVAENVPVAEILKELSRKVHFSYFVSPEIEEKISGNVSGRDLDGLLTYLFSGTQATHRIIDNVYVIGKKKEIDYNKHAVIKLRNRSIDKLIDFIPSDLKESIEIIEFAELNSLFASGPEYQIREFEKFIADIDHSVPVIMIEVIIMYVNKSIAVSTGIEAGLADAPVATGGTVFPNVDITLGADKINQILNGIGWINLGNVAPNFYMTIQAMETQGFLDIESTPKLSTINGHEASLSIGNTEYYLEERTDIMGTQNPTQTTSQVYKSVNAELTLQVRPIMSGNEQITMEIEVSQSDFTERISKTAPPGSVNRKFNSKICVKNQEMILLGGLMEKRESDSGSGTPVFSRIPLLKWFFSSRKYDSSDSKLSLLIRPTIIN